MLVIPSLNLTNSTGPGDDSHSGKRVNTSLRALDSEFETSYFKEIVRTVSLVDILIIYGIGVMLVASAPQLDVQK